LSSRDPSLPHCNFLGVASQCVTGMIHVTREFTDR